MDISLLFGLCWAAACYHDVISLVIKQLSRQGLKLLNYIDDFWIIAGSEIEATQHFNSLHASIKCLSLQEAVHKASTPLQVMLALKFDTVNMSITIPEEKLANMQLIKDWSHKSHATIHQPCTIWGKFFYIAQCCPSSRCFAK